MANESWLFIGKDLVSTGRWEIPPYWMFLFKPEDKVIENSEIFYRSSVAAVTEIL